MTASHARVAAKPMLRTHGLSKTFCLHLQGGVRMDVLSGVDLALASGECVALVGPSGAGKSTLLRSLYGSYRATAGSILVAHDGAWVDIAQADPRTILDVRARTLGYVSQFLRAVPRVSARDVVAEGLAGRASPDDARARAEALLLKLNLPVRLHDLPPATFSGGEQQRVNLARGFIGGHPILLLDEPTASLDPANRDVVAALIREARDAGTAIIGIFHDAHMRDVVADRSYALTSLVEAA